GANWTYVIWGGVHGIYLIVGAATKSARERITRRLFPGRLERFHQFIQVVITFHLFAFSMVIFRARYVSEAFTLVSESVKGFRLDHPLLFKPLSASQMGVAVGAIALMEIAHLLQRRKPVRDRILSLPTPVRWAAYVALLFGILVFGEFNAQEFIYFQF
ncbi:MAG: hypothetical protein GY851_19830, partial [bacterium]|nr:hypothetical protein [bacterium]